MSKIFAKIIDFFSLKDDGQSWGSFALEMAILIIFVLFIRFYVFQPFRVSGPSMCPTLNQYDTGCEFGAGEFVFVNEFSYNFLREPKRGEIIVFKEPKSKVNSWGFKVKRSFIKRIMGIPGDKIEIIDGQVYRTNAGTNEKIKLQEPYLSAQNQGTTSTTKRTFVVPDGKYLVFGDNRFNSLDARRCFDSAFGCNEHNSPYIDQKSIQGKAEYVIFPPSRFRKLQTIDF